MLLSVWEIGDSDKFVIQIRVFDQVAILEWSRDKHAELHRKRRQLAVLISTNFVPGFRRHPRLQRPRGNRNDVITWPFRDNKQSFRAALINNFDH